MSLMFHPTVFKHANDELEEHRLSQDKFNERSRQWSDTERRCGCRHWLTQVVSDEELEKRMCLPHSVCLPSMNPVIRIAYWLDLIETAV